MCLQEANDAKNRALTLSGQMLDAVGPIGSRIHQIATKTGQNYSEFDISLS